MPPGEFIMGEFQPPKEPEKIDDDKASFLLGEYPHRVRITKPFYMGVYEVTQDEYEQVMGKNPTIGYHVDPRAPVERISFENAQTFIEKLSKLSPPPPGYHYALPSEAQWEYACRAGTATRFYTGDTLNSFQANVIETSSPNDPKGPYKGKTVPVGSYQPNAWGLYDMYGNVSEWCQDWCKIGYYKTSPLDDPTGPTTGTVRVVRGGDWGNIAAYCRSANRGADKPNAPGCRRGFRLAIIQGSSGFEIESQGFWTFWLFVPAILLGLLVIYTLIRYKRKRQAKNDEYGHASPG